MLDTTKSKLNGNPAYDGHNVAGSNPVPILDVVPIRTFES